MPAKDPCKAFACRIQDCLKENNFQESACQHAIEDMRECCRIWKDKSFVCGGIDTGKKPEDKYPRLFMTVTTTAALMIFFSKPIYDVFFNPEVLDKEKLLREHKSRFSKN
ncbi:hypothetical protein NQ315_006520 [Exocentrus adspersus]|uniref:Cx9C motif-containing protein 4 n=1 Tax=Exocentrus adspersus TaxID=1586481 RepID=A0AAV8W0C4_9CUCU|nr:hypothetical protein NQ315_006520 [Exocentrus adspersus]